MQLKEIVWCFLLLSSNEAKVLGIQGPVFEIQEADLLWVIENKLQKAQESGKFAKFQEDLAEKMRKRILFPSPTVTHSVSENRSWTYDPSLILSQDLTDQKGVVFAKKGQKFNPLEKVSFGNPLLIVDAQKENQVAWAKGQKGDMVLTQGSPIKLSHALNRPVYFDQEGRITQKFKISHVPARISQKGNILLIEEVLIEKKE